MPFRLFISRPDRLPSGGPCGTVTPHFAERTSMRLIAVAALAGLLATAAHADTMRNCAANWNHMAAADKAKTTYMVYSKDCLKKDTIAGGTAAAAVPPGATAVCKDNTYSMTKPASGRCSHHGGVAKVL
jgi:hypothetical protein